jgi:pantetheine-phosphate adenylyltransferase
VIVAIAENVRKEPLFSTAERAEMVLQSLGGAEPRVEVDSFTGLLVDYAHRRGARVIIRACGRSRTSSTNSSSRT